MLLDALVISIFGSVFLVSTKNMLKDLIKEAIAEEKEGDTNEHSHFSPRLNFVLNFAAIFFVVIALKLFNII